MKKIRGCQAVITAVRVTWRPGCFHVCVVRWVFVLLRLLPASLLLGALPGDVAGMEQTPSGRAAGSVQGGEQWLAPSDGESQGNWGSGDGKELGGLCLPEGNGAASQASLGTSTPFQTPPTPVADPILGWTMLEQPRDVWDELAISGSPQNGKGGLR